MKFVRAVANAALAVVLAGCSSTATDAGTAPSSSQSVAENHLDAVIAADCADLASAYQVCAASTSPWDYEPAHVRQRRDEDEAFLGEVTVLNELPTTELAGAIATYIDGVGLLLAEYETVGEGSTYGVELAAAGVIEEVQTLADEACA